VPPSVTFKYLPQPASAVDHRMWYLRVGYGRSLLTRSNPSLISLGA
jgi:hypothetical protein